jgi:hypothetical protein
MRRRSGCSSADPRRAPARVLTPTPGPDGVSARLPWEPFPPSDPDPKGSDPLHAVVYRAAVAGADAYRGVRLALRREGGVLRVGNRFVPDGRYREVGFVAVGRSANSMALAVLGVLGDRVTQGFLAGPEEVWPEIPFRGVRIPPGWGGAEQAEEVVTAAQEIAVGLRESDLFLLLLSPGAIRALQLPPRGTTAEEFSRTLQAAHDRGIGLFARLLGTGGVGGRLLPTGMVADAETWVVERGDGANAVGGGPTRPVTAAERAEARAAADRVDLATSVPTDAFDPDGPGSRVPARPPATVRPPVAVAGPSDALRGAADAAYDKGWTSRLAYLALRERPEPAAARFVEKVEELLTAEGSGLGRRSKGLVAFAMTTLDLPEAVDEGPALEAFLTAARDRVRRREMSVGLFRTAGGFGEGAPAGGAVVGAAADPGAAGGGDALRPIAMRRGITDVGLLAVGLWTAPPEPTPGAASPNRPPAARSRARPPRSAA